MKFFCCTSSFPCLLFLLFKGFTKKRDGPKKKNKKKNKNFFLFKRSWGKKTFHQKKFPVPPLKKEGEKEADARKHKQQGKKKKKQYTQKKTLSNSQRCFVTISKRKRRFEQSFCCFHIHSIPTLLLDETQVWKRNPWEMMILKGFGI